MRSLLVVLTAVAADGADADLLCHAPALEGKRAAAGQATAWVCEFGVCRAPTSDPAELAAWMLEDGLAATLQLQEHKLLWPGVERGV